jgi:citrate synthase
LIHIININSEGTMSDYLDAKAAAALLGISKATLYAYVSRGLITPRAADGDSRASLYPRDELERLSQHKQRGRKRRDVALSAMQGADLPVIETAQTCIDGGRLYYRGLLVDELARTASLEDVARLLWQFDGIDPFAPPPPVPHTLWRSARDDHAGRSRAERAHTLLRLSQLSINSAVWLKPAAQAQSCASLLRFFVAGMLGTEPSTDPVHVQMAAAWQLDAPRADALRAMLVQLADNVVNPTCFATRLLASLGAPLGAALEAGMCGVYGVLRGGGTPEQVEALWDEVAAADDMAAALTRRLDRGETLPGFGHPAFPEGDSRARWLLALPGLDAQARQLCDAGVALTGEPPNIDFALVAVRRSLGLPTDAAYFILHVSRLVGLLGHALEQQRSGVRLQPLAHYVGPLPGAASA